MVISGLEDTKETVKDEATPPIETETKFTDVMTGKKGMRTNKRSPPISEIKDGVTLAIEGNTFMTLT